MFKIIIQAIKHAPAFWYYFVKDFIHFVKDKGWNKFNFWGLHVFVGRFGSGKTISMVKRCYDICRKYKGVTVLTNLSLTDFPEGTNIIKFFGLEQLRKLPNSSIILIDEIGSIFNNRDVMKNKESVPKPALQFILQCRKRRVMLLGTVQRWNLMDKQLRDITDTVTECKSTFGDPFARYTTCSVYNAEFYDNWYSNPLLPLRRLDYYGYVQTDELRARYDTVEMVEGMLNANYIPDAEILANRGEIGFQPQEFQSKKARRAVNRAIGKR